MKLLLAGTSLLACLQQSLCTDGLVLLQSQVQKSEDSHAVASLFPSLTMLKDPRQSHAALAQIKQKVMSLASDKSQVTPAVVELMTQVIEMLSGGLVPIDNDHGIDQGALDDAFTAFNACQMGLIDAKATLATSDTESTIATQVDAVSSCNTQKETECQDVETCLGETANATTAWAKANISLTHKDTAIHEYWCTGHPEDSARTAMAFRSESGEKFIQYNNALDVLRNTAADKEEKEQICSTHQEKHSTTIEQCSLRKTTVTNSGCSLYAAVHAVIDTYLSTFDRLSGELRDAKAPVYLREGDRKVEWDVLKRVTCLLSTLTGTEDGDASSAATRASIEACSSMTVNVTHLDIEYPSDPPRQLLPSLPYYPCGTEFQQSLGSSFESTCTVQDSMYGLDLTTTCSCQHPEATAPESPILPYYLLVDAPTNCDFYKSDPSTWGATCKDSYLFATGAGALSTMFAVANPFVIKGETIKRVGFMHGDPSVNEHFVNSQENSQTRTELMLREGGMFLESDTGLIPMAMVASASALTTAPQLLLSFGAAQDIDDQVDSVCSGGFQPVVDGSFAPQDATEYCYQMTSSACCAQGCFIFKFSFGWKCYPQTGGLTTMMQD